MITLNHLVYDIKNIIYGGIVPDDADISNRQIAYWVNQTRALLLRQEFSRRTLAYDEFIQFITVNMEEVSTEPCVSTGCKIIRSTQIIPSTIRSGARNGIISVASLTNNRAFTETTPIRVKWNQYNKYTGNLPRWYLWNNYLYITNVQGIEKLQVGAIFEDPTEAAEFINCEGNLCFTWDNKYPITADMATIITDIIIKNKVSVIVQDIKGDDTNDAQDKKIQ